MRLCSHDGKILVFWLNVIYNIFCASKHYQNGLKMLFSTCSLRWQWFIFMNKIPVFWSQKSARVHKVYIYMSNIDIVYLRWPQRVTVLLWFFLVWFQFATVSFWFFYSFILIFLSQSLKKISSSSIMNLTLSVCFLSLTNKNAGSSNGHLCHIKFAAVRFFLVFQCLCHFILLTCDSTMKMKKDLYLVTSSRGIIITKLSSF
jgi:hypothetical protein